MAEYRLSATARADIIEILAWTHEHFGELARRRYERLLVTACATWLPSPSGPEAPAAPNSARRFAAITFVTAATVRHTKAA